MAVPRGRLTIAQRFNAGDRPRRSPTNPRVPKGRLTAPLSRPFGTSAATAAGAAPAMNRRAIVLRSLRDEGRASHAMCAYIEQHVRAYSRIRVRVLEAYARAPAPCARLCRPRAGARGDRARRAKAGKANNGPRTASGVREGVRQTCHRCAPQEAQPWHRPWPSKSSRSDHPCFPDCAMRSALTDERAAVSGRLPLHPRQRNPLNEMLLRQEEYGDDG